MEELIVQLADEQEDRKKFKEMCTQMYRYLTSKKIKDLNLFKQRTGTEYQQFYESLDFSPEMKEVLLNEDFFELLIKQSRRFRR
jgi:hypothetical protein